MTRPEYLTHHQELPNLLPGPTISLIAETQNVLPTESFTNAQLQQLNALSTFNGAAALACYAQGTATPLDFLTKGEKYQLQSDRVATSTRKAGHHSTIEHVNYTYLLQNTSRLAIWQVLHSHPHLVSDQQSQRYVPMSPEGLVFPRFDKEKANQIFLNTAQSLFSGYQQLNTLLRPDVERHYQNRYGQNNPAAIDKLTQEISRYLLPQSMGANLYHTINALTLIRYHNLSQTYPCGPEARVLIQGMVETVCQCDPSFRNYLNEPLPQNSPAAKAIEAFGTPNQMAFESGITDQLNGNNVNLETPDIKPSQQIANAVRLHLGYPPSQMSDSQALDCVLNPANNPYLASVDGEIVLDQFSQTLNTATVGFLVRLSLSADAQLQRHRGFSHIPQRSIPLPIKESDFYIPPIITENQEALDLYHRLSNLATQSRAKLIDMGVESSLTEYLATNNTLITKQIKAPVGPLYHFAAVRSCYRAQEEIWRLNLEMLRQLQQHDPILGAYFNQPTPCAIRRQAGLTPPCPEAKHQWCGLPNWQKELLTLPDRRI